MGGIKRLRVFWVALHALLLLAFFGLFGTFAEDEGVELRQWSLAWVSARTFDAFRFPTLILMRGAFEAHWFFSFVGFVLNLLLYAWGIEKVMLALRESTKRR